MSLLEELPLLADQLRFAPSRSRLGAIELTLRTCALSAHHVGTKH